jgi:hypothetical protein
MTIEPAMLQSVITLVLGREPGDAFVADLARVLDQRDEVLPWVVLRSRAFDDDAEVQAQLRALAAAGNRPNRQRPHRAVIEPQSYQRARDVETALAAMIAANIAGAAQADTIGALLHAENRTLPGRPGYDFRRRIAEFAPDPAEALAVEADVTAQGGSETTGRTPA